MPPTSNLFVCDQHASNISAKLQTFYQDQLFFDIALTNRTANFKVHAHRTVLSASSDYFRSTLKEAKSDVIELEIDVATLKLVVDFMYSGTIELRCENVARILTAAHVLKMSTLKFACSDFIRETIDVTNWLSIGVMAKQQESAELHKKVVEFALHHFEEVCKKKEFLQLTKEQFSELISSDDLCVNSEETVFHSVVSWMNYDKGLRKESMIGLLSHVRFSFLRSDFIIDNRQSLCKTYECLELLFSWLESHLSSKKLPKRHSERKKTLDAESNIWTCNDLPPSPTKRETHSAIFIDEKLVVTGGSIYDHSTNIVECLDLQTMEWSNFPPMRQPRGSPVMAELNGDLYVVSGYSYVRWLRSIEKYDIRTREWQELAPMHSEKTIVQVTVLGELLYAMSNDGSPIDCFDPVYNKWTQLPHKNERSRNFGIAGVGEYLYAVGGSHKGQASKTVERFNPSTSTWTVVSPGLPLALRYLRCVSWNNQLLVVGNKVYHQSSIVKYSPEENEWRTVAPFVGDCTVFDSLFVFTK